MLFAAEQKCDAQCDVVEQDRISSYWHSILYQLLKALARHSSRFLSPWGGQFLLQLRNVLDMHTTCGKMTSIIQEPEHSCDSYPSALGFLRWIISVYYRYKQAENYHSIGALTRSYTATCKYVNSETSKTKPKKSSVVGVYKETVSVLPTQEDVNKDFFLPVLYMSLLFTH